MNYLVNERCWQLIYWFVEREGGRPGRLSPAEAAHCMVHAVYCTLQGVGRPFAIDTVIGN